MSFIDLLKDTCTIQSKTATQQGTGVKTFTWATKVANVLTRKRRNNKPNVYDELSKTFIDDYIFYFKVDTDVKINDRILADGEAYEILSVATDSERHHIEAVAKITRQ